MRRQGMMAGIVLLLAGAAALPLAAQEKPRSDIDKVGDTAEDIAERPLKDLNLMKEKIPPELQAIMDAPYDIAALKTCPQYAAAVARLTKVLGPDVDSAEARNQKGESATEFVLSGAQSVVGSLIPGAGIVRKISGAEKAERQARAAVLAGHLRRAYIKGTARTKGCKM